MKQIIYKCLNKECNCEFKGNNEDGLCCPKCNSSIVPFKLNPTSEELAKVISYEKLKSNPFESGLVVTVSLTNTEQFKQAAALLASFITDDRIAENIRHEYDSKFKTYVKHLKE
jgi:DNA-directed RNA polymerase subunit RPC12/RpoP